MFMFCPLGTIQYQYAFTGTVRQKHKEISFWGLCSLVFSQGVQLPFRSPVQNAEHASEEITSGNPHNVLQNQATLDGLWMVYSAMSFLFLFSCYCCLDASALYKRTKLYGY